MKIETIRKLFETLCTKDVSGRVEEVFISQKETKVYCFELEIYITIPGRDYKAGDFLILPQDSELKKAIASKQFDMSLVSVTKEKDIQQNKDFKSLLSANEELGMGEKTAKKVAEFINTLRAHNKNDRDINLWNILEGTCEKTFSYVNKHGTLYEIRLQPDILIQHKIVGRESVKRITNSFAKVKTEMIQKFVAFRSFGFNDDESISLIKSGIGIEEFKNNPYTVLKYYGLNINKVDYIAIRILKFSYNDPNRIRAYIGHILKHIVEEESHVYLYMDDLMKALKRAKISDIETIGSVINLLASQDRDAEDAIVRIGDAVMLYEIYKVEKDISTIIKDRLSLKRKKSDILYELQHNDELLDSYIKRFNDLTLQRDGFPLHPIQNDGIKASVKSNTSILTGSAGTGKTTIVEGIVFVLKTYMEEHAPAYEFENEISFFAPTGNAASRLSEVVNYKAQTIHRGLKYNPFGPKDERFFYNKANKLPYSFIIVDEISMIDDRLFLHLIEAIKNDAILILVGDHNQLPSVDVGDICYELIHSGKIPTTKLTKVFRQKEGSTLYQNCVKVLEGKTDLLTGDDFEFIEISDGDAEANYLRALGGGDALELFNANDYLEDVYREKMLREVKKINSSLTGEKSKQFLGLTKKGSFGANIVNQYLSTLNPNPTIPGWIFKKGDKVIQTKNYYDKDASVGYDIMNGMQGVAEEIDQVYKSCSIKFDLFKDPVELRRALTHNIELAYSISVHKSQGLGFDYCIIPVFLDKSTKPMLYRKLIYTALTRGKKKVIFIGKRKALNDAILNNKEEKRRSLLSQMLQQSNASAANEIAYIKDLKL